MSQNLQRTFLGIALITAVALVAFGPALSGAFIWDDEGLIAQNRVIHDGHGLARIWFSTEAIDYWPVTNTTFWLEWRLFGTDTVGYHAVNVVLHIANSLLVWLILRKLQIPGAFFAALLLAVHPVNVESVAWIAQLKNVLALFFALLSVWYYLDATSEPAGGSRRSSWYGISLILFALAMLSKGSVAIVPPVLILLDWWRRGEITADRVKRTLPFWTIAVALTVKDVCYQTHGTGEVIRSATFAQRLLAAGESIWFYLCKAFAPLGLNFVYPQWHVDPADVLWWLPSIGAIAITIGLWWKRETAWGRPLLFAWLFYCIALVPVLGFADVYFMRYSLVADHYQYIALIGVAALLGAMFEKACSAAATFASRLTLRSGRFIVHRSPLIVGVCLLVAFVCFSRCQSENYRDATTLWHATLERNPDCPLVHTNLGRELQKQTRFAEAIEHFRAAIRLDPWFPEAHGALGSAMAAIGRRQEAIEECERAIELQPKSVQAHNDLAGLLLSSGQFAAAIDHCKIALSLDPKCAEAHSNLGIALSACGDEDQAISHFRESIRLAPQNAETYNNLANALVKAVRCEEAIPNYEIALRLKPDYLQARSNLAIAYAKGGNLPKAIDAAEQAIAIADALGDEPQSKKLRAWVAFLTAQHKRIDTAVRPAGGESPR